MFEQCSEAPPIPLDVGAGVVVIELVCAHHEAAVYSRRQQLDGSQLLCFASCGGWSGIHEFHNKRLGQSGGENFLAGGEDPVAFALGVQLHAQLRRDCARGCVMQRATNGSLALLEHIADVDWKLRAEVCWWCVRVSAAIARAANAVALHELAQCSARRAQHLLRRVAMCVEDSVSSSPNSMGVEKINGIGCIEFVSACIQRHGTHERVVRGKFAKLENVICAMHYALLLVYGHESVISAE